ncbi:MAG: hypothetical protein C5S48_06720 [Candidatus Methanogaster sp.]|nr:MAG: hypothetical protein C5S48_06720 [ANME-2 cluster archaeon]
MLFGIVYMFEDVQSDRGYSVTVTVGCGSPTQIHPEHSLILE